MMPGKPKTILERLAEEGIHLGADTLDVDYKDGYEEVFAMKRGVGHAIAMLRSSSAEAATLRDELHAIARRSGVSPWMAANGSCSAASLKASERTRFACGCAVPRNLLGRMRDWLAGTVLTGLGVRLAVSERR